LLQNKQMGIFDIFKKPTGPYKVSSANRMYELLFCDNLDLDQDSNQQPNNYPWNTLFSDASNNADLEKIIEDTNIESRIKIFTNVHELNVNAILQRFYIIQEKVQCFLFILGQVKIKFVHQVIFQIEIGAFW
jgi:hypothetical protein